MSGVKKNLTYYKKKVEKNTISRDEMDEIIPLIDEKAQALRNEERELSKLRQTVSDMAAAYDKEQDRKRAQQKGEELIAKFGPDVLINNLVLVDDAEEVALEKDSDKFSNLLIEDLLEDED